MKVFFCGLEICLAMWFAVTGGCAWYMANNTNS